MQMAQWSTGQAYETVIKFGAHARGQSLRSGAVEVRFGDLGGGIILDPFGRVDFLVRSFVLTG